MGAMVAMFLAALDQTIVAPALPPIAREPLRFCDTRPQCRMLHVQMFL